MREEMLLEPLPCVCIMEDARINGKRFAFYFVFFHSLSDVPMIEPCGHFVNSTVRSLVDGRC